MQKTLRYSPKEISKRIGLGACWYGVCWGAGDNISTYGGAVDTANFVLTAAVGVSALGAVFVLVYGGILLITSGGDSDKIQKGFQTIQYSILGLIIIFLAALIIRFVYDNIVG